jgi:hypothetical protein
VSETKFGLWVGLGCAILYLIVSVIRNHRLTIEQVGIPVGVALACQNILPPIDFILFSMHGTLPSPLAGQEKYLLVAGLASEVVTVVSLYSLLVQALRRY